MPAAGAESDRRFSFGQNWIQFSKTLDERRIELSQKSFSALLGDGPMAGKRMLDIGCGSGLSSLVARRLGMAVHAFDFDPDAVTCSEDLRRRFITEGEDWVVECGDVLDESFMRRLGKFDLVYAWGSLHHTGNMWRAIENAAGAAALGGLFFLAIYNDQGGTSRRWRSIKQLYHKLPSTLRPLLVAACVPVQWWKDVLKGVMHGRPLAAWHNYAAERGMSPWYDMVDWVGGYPFEVAKPEEIFEFLHARGFSLERLKTVGGGLGCNEFVFRKS